MRWLNRLIQRFSFLHSCSPSCVRPQFLRGWCQILWLAVDCRGSSLLSRWSFKNDSHNTRTILCISRQSRIAARQCPGTQKSRSWIKDVGRSRAAPWFRIVKIFLHHSRNSLCSEKQPGFFSNHLTHSRRRSLLLRRQFLAFSCMFFLEEPISQFQFFIQANFISLSLISPPTRWDSNSWLISLDANSEFHFSQFFDSTSASASHNFCWTILYPRTAASTFRSKSFWRFSLSFKKRTAIFISITFHYWYWAEKCCRNRFFLNIRTRFSVLVQTDTWHSQTAFPGLVKPKTLDLCLLRTNLVLLERGRIVHEVQVAEGIGDLRAKVWLMTCVWCEVSQRTRLPLVTCGCDLCLILAVDVEEAEGGEVGAGGEHIVHVNDTGVGRRGGKSIDMTQQRNDKWHTRSLYLEPCGECASMCSREKCVCVCIHVGGHIVYSTVALTAVATGWLRSLVSATSTHSSKTKSRTQCDGQNSLLSKVLMFLEPMWCIRFSGACGMFWTQFTFNAFWFWLVSSWFFGKWWHWTWAVQNSSQSGYPRLVWTHIRAQVDSVPFYESSAHSPSCQFLWYHESQFWVQDDECHLLELGVLVDEEDDGWCFSSTRSAGYSWLFQFYQFQAAHLDDRLSRLMAEHNVHLLQVLANTDPVWSNLNPFNVRMCLWSPPFLRRASVSISDVVCPSFLCSIPVLLLCLFSKVISTSVLEVECCCCGCSCCWHCQFFFNVTFGAWCLKPFEKYSFSVLGSHTINAIFMYRPSFRHGHHTALSLISERKLVSSLGECVWKFMMLNKQRRWFHSSHE